VLSDQAHVFYKVSTLYDPLEERSFRFDDPAVGIRWPIGDPLLSERDLISPSLREALQ
jgi:dTDP-4-dehydrorhamnose 3,5-epimerase